MAIFDDDSFWLVLRRLLGRPEPGPANLSVPPRLYRQGDVLLLEVAQLPADAVRETRRGPRLVLALGEATGHAHAVGRGRSKAALYGHNGRRYLELTTPVRLVHEEHAAIGLPPGTFEVRIQREYVAPEAPRGGRRVGRFGATVTARDGHRAFNFSAPLTRRVVD